MSEPIHKLKEIIEMIIKQNFPWVMDQGMGGHNLRKYYDIILEFSLNMPILQTFAIRHNNRMTPLYNQEKKLDKIRYIYADDFTLSKVEVGYWIG